VAVLTISSCATMRASNPSPMEEPPTIAAQGRVEDASREAAVRSAVVASARALLGKAPESKVTLRGKQFTLDCTGTISAAWWDAGYDIQKDYSRYQGNGVQRLYRSLEAWGALHDRKIPRPGDIIFWENTYDRNENGDLNDDGLTHAGLVMEVEADGTVHYLHESYSRGVVIAYFNLLHPREPKSPAGKIWNSPMYLGSNYGKSNNPTRWLSGDLWASFGDAERTAENTKKR